MTQSTAEAREQLLHAVGEATDRIGFALASLGAAYEQLDEDTADRLEETLFRPLQLAYGRGRRIYTEFAGRHGLPSRSFETPSPGLASIGAPTFIEHAVGQADTALSELQDSLLPLDVGDAELRAALAELRELIGDLPLRARELMRTIGR
jgi:hypothetical protein